MAVYGTGDPKNPHDSLHSHSICTVRLELFFNDTLIGFASGVLAETDQGKYLITALHCLTGREPDGRSKGKGRPNRLMYRGYNVSGEIKLFDGKDFPEDEIEAHFFVHSEGPHIDVAVAPLNTLHPSAYLLPSCFLDEVENAKWLPLYVTMPCYIVGFPKGHAVKAGILHGEESILPVWKTGTIASEPYFDANLADGKSFPSFYIDALTREGMSGAPVFASAGEIYEPAGPGYVKRMPEFTRFLGIYAGRIIPEEYLGYVFKPSIITDILRNKKRFKHKNYSKT